MLCLVLFYYVVGLDLVFDGCYWLLCLVCDGVGFGVLGFGFCVGCC